MTEKITVKVGIHETALQVPLFTELYGYGPFLGRRNRGTRDPLYCRALTFFDGKQRNIMIVTDAVVTDDKDARDLREQIAREHDTYPAGIMLAGTHTHSGPAMALGIGWGERDAEYLQHWRETVINTVRAAVASEEEVKACAGIAALSKKLGINRVTGDEPTDPSIRWIKFCRADGSVKALLHNHGMHGVVFGSAMLRVSADWMGETNRLIKERGLAETPFFVYGAAGNINTNPCCLNEQKGEPILQQIGEAYIDDLQKSLQQDGREISLAPVQNILQGVALPTILETPAQMRRNAEIIRSVNDFLANRFEEMAILAENGETFQSAPDFQILRMGDFAVYTFPGEPFCELGRRIMDEAPYPFVIAAAMANGNHRYFPTQETYEMFPDGIASEKRGYGFYEIHQGAGCFKLRYQQNIANYIVDHLLTMKPQ